MVRTLTQRILACIWHISVLNRDPDSYPLEVKPRPMKTIYRLFCSSASSSRQFSIEVRLVFTHVGNKLFYSVYMFGHMVSCLLMHAPV